MTLENEVPVSPPVPHTKREAVAPLLPKRHRQFTIKEKMATIRTVQRLMDNGDMTWCKACNKVNIHHTMHTTWTKQLDAMCRTRMASQRPFVSAVLPVWNHIKMIYCDSFLNFESKEWRFQCQWWWWRQHKLPQNYVWSPEWLSITRRLGLCVLKDLFFVLELTNRNARLLPRPPLRHWTTLPM